MEVSIQGKLLYMTTGTGYYDLNKTLKVSEITTLIEEVGVRGGHVGWRLMTKDDQEYGHDFGRGCRPVMEEVKNLIESGEINAKIVIEKDKPQKCY